MIDEKCLFRTTGNILSCLFSGRTFITNPVKIRGNNQLLSNTGFVLDTDFLSELLRHFPLPVLHPFFKLIVPIMEGKNFSLLDQNSYYYSLKTFYSMQSTSVHNFSFIVIRKVSFKIFLNLELMESYFHGKFFCKDDVHHGSKVRDLFVKVINKSKSSVRYDCCNPTFDTHLSTTKGTKR